MASCGGKRLKILGFGCGFADLDGDGDEDVVILGAADGHVGLFENDGSGHFTDRSAGSAIPPLTEIVGFAAADVDGDGDLDLYFTRSGEANFLARNDGGWKFINNLGGNVELFINHEGETRSWVRYRFGGTGPNRFAVGGNVDTGSGTAWQLREVLAGSNGYLGQNELTLHVGLNAAVVVDEAVASWPGGAPVRTLTNLPANRTWTLYPPEALGDGDGDGTVDLTDFAVFADCFNAATFEPGCEMMDFDGDSTVDLLDYNAFVGVFDEVPEDCNSNGTFDMREILLDPSLDLNKDGWLDECETCGACDDGLYCNGVETCLSGSCQAGTPVDCDDGVSCTADSCDEASDSCASVPDDGLCDNGLFCDGAETCDPALDCQPGSDPCGGGACDEKADLCTTVCGDGVCDDGEDCLGCAADCPSFDLPGADCGNGVCEADDGEDCVSCPQDCDGVQGGKPSGRFCCGFGGDNPVGACSCAADCGPPPASEANLCTDGVDNDCDLAVDCADADCDGIDPACAPITRPTLIQSS